MSSFRYLLDTNVLIDARRGREPVAGRVARLARAEAAQSAVTYGELFYGTQKSRDQGEAMRIAREAALLVPVLPVGVKAAEAYGSIRAALEGEGRIIGSNDLWIAAHALSEGLILVTRNEREFRRVPGLQIENWAAAT